MAARLAWISPRRISASAGGSVAASRSTRTKTFAPSLEMPGRCSWPLSRQRVGFGYERADVGAAGQDRSVKSVERTIEPGDAEHEAERRAAGEGRHAWPGRSEIPIEQDA